MSKDNNQPLQAKYNADRDDIYAPIYLTFKNEIKKLLKVFKEKNEKNDDQIIKMHQYPAYEHFLYVYNNFSVYHDGTTGSRTALKDFMIHKFTDIVPNTQTETESDDLKTRQFTNKQIKESLRALTNPSHPDKEREFIKNNILITDSSKNEVKHRIAYLEKLKPFLRDNCFIKFVKNDPKINDNILITGNFSFTPLFTPIENGREANNNINAFIVKSQNLGNFPFQSPDGLIDDPRQWHNLSVDKLNEIKQSLSRHGRTDIYLTDIRAHTQGIVYNCVNNIVDERTRGETQQKTRAQYEFMIELINELYSTIILFNIVQNPAQAKADIKSANKLFRRLYAVKANRKDKMDSNFYFDRLPRLSLPPLLKKFMVNKGGKKETKPKVKKPTKPKVKKETKPKVKKPTKSKVKKPTKSKVKKETNPKVKKETKPKVKKPKVKKPKVKKPTKPKVNK